MRFFLSHIKLPNRSNYQDEMARKSFLKIFVFFKVLVVFDFRLLYSLQIVCASDFPVLLTAI